VKNLESKKKKGEGRECPIRRKGNKYTKKRREIILRKKAKEKKPRQQERKRKN